MRITALLPLALSFAVLACDAAPPASTNGEEPLGEAADAVTNVCPPATTVSGIDIASYQHPGGAAINWASVATTEKFVIIKATQGTGYTNSYYAGDASGARAAGLVVGAYHFLAPSAQTGQTGKAQADHFVTQAAVQAGDMPPMLDLEATSQYNNVLPSVTDIVDFLNEVELKTGRKPFVYVGYYTLSSLAPPNPSQLATYLIDVPSYGACPNFPNSYPLANLVMWQNSSTTAVPGISGGVDHDVFYGDMTKFDTFAHPPPTTTGSTSSTTSGTTSGTGSSATSTTASSTTGTASNGAGGSSSTGTGSGAGGGGATGPLSNGTCKCGIAGEESSKGGLALVGLAASIATTRRRRRSRR